MFCLGANDHIFRPFSNIKDHECSGYILNNPFLSFPKLCRIQNSIIDNSMFASYVVSIKRNAVLVRGMFEDV